MSETAASAPASDSPATGPVGTPVAPAAPSGVEATVVETAVPAAVAPPINPLEQTLLDAPAEPEKTAEPAKPAAPIDPASYEVKLPDGITREDPMVSTFLASAAELGLQGAAVQTVLDKMAPLVAEQLAAPMKAWQELNTAWQAEIRADTVLGGTKLPAAVATINSALDRFGTPELKSAMAATGAANNPHIFRFLHTLASAYVEATPVAAGNSGHIAPTQARALSMMYPSASQPNGAA